MVIGLSMMMGLDSVYVPGVTTITSPYLALETAVFFLKKSQVVGKCERQEQEQFSEKERKIRKK